MLPDGRVGAAQREGGGGHASQGRGRQRGSVTGARRCALQRRLLRLRKGAAGAGAAAVCFREPQLPSDISFDEADGGECLVM